MMTSIERNGLFNRNDQLILAVSGGVDSVVLCSLIKEAGYLFRIAHCNFQLRGEESKRDEDFVRSLAEQHHVEFLLKRFDTESCAAEKKISIQEAARALRYEWFRECCAANETKQTTYVLTAHHAEDNIETVLMNFFRGTGLHGLTGIPAKGIDEMDYIRRPLLDVSKEEIIQFAGEKDLSWVEDSSNASDKYTRNYFRNELIPSIEKVYPQAKENIKDNIRRFKEIEVLYNSQLASLKSKMVLQKRKEFHIPVRLLMKYNNRALIYDIIRDYGFHENQIDEIIKLAKSESGKYIASPGGHYRIIKHRRWFIVAPLQPESTNNIVVEGEGPEIRFAGGVLSIKKKAVSGTITSSSDETAMLDALAIDFPLLLRKVKTGDYFYPLGMKKKKKINRFLIDKKLSKTAKENVWVIESGQRIIWVVGHRIDERFKLTPQTKQVIELSLHPSK